MRKNFGPIITRNYQVILPHFDAYGQLHSLCVTENKAFIVKKEPLQIIKDSIAYYGGSLSGALHGAKTALGDIHLPPLQICARQGMYWFYIKGLTNKANIFISYSHIKDVRKTDNKTVTLMMKNDFNLAIPVSVPRMQKRIADAYCYSNIMQSRTLPKRKRKRQDDDFPGIIFDPDKEDFDLDE